MSPKINKFHSQKDKLRNQTSLSPTPVLMRIIVVIGNPIGVIHPQIVKGIINLLVLILESSNIEIAQQPIPRYIAPKARIALNVCMSPKIGFKCVYCGKHPTRTIPIRETYKMPVPKTAKIFLIMCPEYNLRAINGTVGKNKIPDAVMPIHHQIHPRGFLIG